VALRLVRPLRSFGLKTPTQCACKATSVFMSHNSAMVKTHPLTFRIEPEFNLFGGERGRKHDATLVERSSLSWSLQSPARQVCLTHMRRVGSRVSATGALRRLRPSGVRKERTFDDVAAKCSTSLPRLSGASVTNKKAALPRPLQRQWRYDQAANEAALRDR
jgi:hypothetical protein